MDTPDLKTFRELFGCDTDLQSDALYLRWQSDDAAFGAIHANGALTRLDDLAVALGVEWIVIGSSNGGPPLRVWPAGLMRAVKTFYQREYKRQRRGPRS